MEKHFRQFNLISTLKYLLSALLIVIPLYPKFPIFNVPGTYVAIRAEDFLISAIALAWFLLVLRSGFSNFLKGKLNQAILLYLLAGLLSCLSSVFLTKTAPTHIVFLHWARRIEYLIPFFAAVEVIKYAKHARFLITSLFIATFFVFTFGFGQIHFNFPVITTQNEEYSKGLALRWIAGARLSSTFAGHYDLSAFLVVLLPISTALFWYYKKIKNRILFLVFSVLPSFWLILRAESRVSFISFLFGISVSLWLIKKRILIIPVLIATILCGVLFTNLGVRYKNSIKTYWQKITFVAPAFAQSAALERSRSKQTENEKPQMPSIFEDRSTAIRLNVEWPRAIRAFMKNPLLGTGYSSITLATDNDYLRLLGETGILGVSAFFLVILRLLMKLFGYIKIVRKNWSWYFVCGLAAGFAGLLLNATFIDVFEASKVAIIFWTLAGVAIGIVSRDEKA